MGSARFVVASGGRVDRCQLVHVDNPQSRRYAARVLTRFPLFRPTHMGEPRGARVWERSLAIILFTVMLLGALVLSGSDAAHGVEAQGMTVASNSVAADTASVGDSHSGSGHQSESPTCIGCTPFSAAQTSACTLVLLLLFSVLLFPPAITALGRRGFLVGVGALSLVEAPRSPFSLPQLCVSRT